MNGHQRKVLQFHNKFGLTVQSSPRIPCDKDIECRKNLINEEAREFNEASDARDLIAIADALADLLYVVYGAAITYGIDIEPVFDEVHRSNMTKLWTKEEVEELTEEQRGALVCYENTFIPTDTSPRPNTIRKYLVKRVSDGKVIKSPSYSEADIQGALRISGLD